MSPRLILTGTVVGSLLPFLLVTLFPSPFQFGVAPNSYLLFHNIAEFFSIMVSLSVFGVGWYSYDQSKNQHVLFLSWAFLVIGLLDFMHTLANAAMPAFVTANSTNKSTQFWIASRCFSAGALVISAWVYPQNQRRWLTRASLMTIGLTLSGLVFVAITFFPSYLPDTFSEGVGLTAFKKLTEYLIVLLLVGAAMAYWKRMTKTADRTLMYYLAALVISIVSELFFATYRRAFDTYNILGHLYKIVAFYLIYQGVFVTSVKNPYAILADTNERLRTEMAERKRAEVERIHAEAELRQAQKMKALGTLAGGIAHDFNNILGIIVGYTEMARWHAGDSNAVQSELQEVLKATNRAKELVKQILAFSRQGDQGRTPVEIGLVVKEVSKMLRASLPSTIDIKTDVDSRAAVLADASQLHQVLMNLCTNAAQAMSDGGGVLEVSLTDVMLEPESVRSSQGLTPGPHVKLTVKDTGHGIPPTVMDRIFEPFFSTREVGAGTGLGLAVVDGIVKSHSGAIEVVSCPGGGTTFQVFLPAIESIAETQVLETAALPRGCERILIVDDEPALALVVKQILQRLGYEADYRTDPVEALEFFRLSLMEKPFEAVVTDMTMPHCTGMELSRELLRLQPSLPIVLCSGFSDKVDAEKARTLGIRWFLSKPVVASELAGAIRKVLDGRTK